mgnify:CR=1 FL=1
MSWREDMQAGSFRGVPFKVKSGSGQLGRRVALHEYPGRDLPYPEDLGKQSRRLQLDMLVVGPDYMAARDALIDAFEQAGPGELIHPWQGRIWVSVLEVNGPQESTRHGGMARFAVTFVRAGDQPLPQQQADTGADIAAQATDASEQNVAEFADTFDVAGPEFIAASATSKLNQLTTALDRLSRQTTAPGDLAAGLASDLNDFSSGLTDLLRAPGDLALKLIGLVQDLGSMAQKPLGAIELYRQLLAFGDDDSTVPTVTLSRIKQADNQTAVNSLVQRSALIAAVQQSGQVDYDSLDQALALRDELAAQIDRLSETAGDTLYTALDRLRVALVQDIAVRGADLARLAWHTPLTTLPALVLAHRLYGDPARELDLIVRNGIAHPGFVQGGDPLEVLIDD